MEYLLTIIIFMSPTDKQFTTLETKSIEECLETGYNALNLYKALGKRAEIKCEKLDS